jgi:hypothetical protein
VWSVAGPRRRFVQASARSARQKGNCRGLVAIACDSVAATVPEHQRDWVYDLRKGKRSIAGGLFRFIDFLHRRGWPMETALMIPAWLESYIRECYTGSPEQAAQSVPLKRTG